MNLRDANPQVYVDQMLQNPTKQFMHSTQELFLFNKLYIYSTK